MAFLRKHKRSPFWYLKRRNLDSGTWEERSTGLRHDNQSDTRKAQRAADKASASEKQVGAPGSSAALLAWVPSYIESHWRTTDSGSRGRYRVAWQAIRRFLAEHDIVYPRQVRHVHGEAYMRWRRRTEVHGKSVGHNTALLELKFLSQLLNESVRREFAEANPLARLGIGRSAPKPKREFTALEIKKLRAAFRSQPAWMGIAFEISLYTGCRFSETSILIDQIDFRTNTIRMRDSKRTETDERKFFTIPIARELRPLLWGLKKSGARVTCELSQDKNGRINKVIRRTLGDGSFHCLRVTFVTWCHRAGLSEAEAMRLVNHSSQLVHRIYSKLNVEDVRRAQRRIRFPPAAAIK